ncbi:MAG: DUF2589 domain-containing protein [Flavobacteriaceae bacterium]|nr:MAG: DUF2589 domain-containing protein [Flavobacteriaceae bacterium]
MNLEQLVSVIQKGALAASTAIQNQSLKLIDLYFEETDGEDLNTSLKDALISSMSGQDKKRATELAEKIMSSISTDLKDVFAKARGKLKPKTVTIQYPRETAKGVVSQEVIVPLISLVPISLTEMSQVKFKTDLEVNLVDDELAISFPEKIKDRESDVNIASLEVVIDKTHPTDGLKKLIEGYDRALRAQIPG